MYGDKTHTRKQMNTFLHILSRKGQFVQRQTMRRLIVEQKASQREAGIEGERSTQRHLKKLQLMGVEPAQSPKGAFEDKGVDIIVQEISRWS